jgi:membrane-bound inhibitor of C-type lysozyme
MRILVLTPLLLLVACGDGREDRKQSVAAFVAQSKASPVPPAALVTTVAYVCEDGTQLEVTFDNPRQMATVAIPNAPTTELLQEKTASGIWYRNGQYELRGRGSEANWSAGGATPTACRSLA